MKIPINIDKTIDEVTDVVDKSFESEQERQEMLTERQRIDSTSPFRLPHLIRPISTMFSGLIWGVSIIWALIIASIKISELGIEQASSVILASDSIVMYVLAATSTTYGTHIGFYFESRKKEKITAKKASVALDIERMKVKEEIKLNRKEERQNRKSRRRQERNQE
jgi:hypothetical protein